MQPPVKAYSYLRFSTPEQAGGDSFRRQLFLAREYALKNGLELDEALTYRDAGVSAFRGKNAETGALADFREAVHAGLVPTGSYLLVESLDRISRAHARKALRVLEDICDAGVVVVTLNDGKRYNSEALNSDPMALILSMLTFIRANEESETKSKRLRAAWEHKRSRAVNGEKLTSLCPAWLRLAPDRKGWEVIEERAAVVRRIFGDVVAGRGPHSIAYALNAEAVPCFGRGRRWYRSYVIKLLQSTAVIGTYQPTSTEYRDGRKVRRLLDPVPGYYPSIVEEAVFLNVASLNGSLAPTRGRHAGRPLRNILSGLAVCGRCGSPITRVNKGKPPKGGDYLVCSSAKNGAGCKYEAIRYPLIEDMLRKDLPEILDCAPVGIDGGLRAGLERIESQQLALTDHIEALLDVVAKTKSPAALDRLSKYETLLAELAEEEREILGQMDVVAGPLVRSRIDTALSCLRDGLADRAPLNAALRRLISSVEIRFDEGCLVFNWKAGGTTEALFRFPSVGTG